MTMTTIKRGRERRREKERKKKKKALSTHIHSRPRRYWQITGLFRRLAVLFKEELKEDKDKNKK